MLDLCHRRREQARIAVRFSVIANDRVGELNRRAAVQIGASRFVFLEPVLPSMNGLRDLLVLLWVGCKPIQVLKDEVHKLNDVWTAAPAFGARSGRGEVREFAFDSVKNLCRAASPTKNRLLDVAHAEE